jgi:mitochondrial FAD-linked sulfhydryl oxidase
VVIVVRMYFLIDAYCKLLADNVQRPAKGVQDAITSDGTSGIDATSVAVAALGTAAVAPRLPTDAVSVQEHDTTTNITLQSSAGVAHSGASPEAAAKDATSTVMHGSGANTVLQEALQRPCRACTSAQDMFAAFHAAQAHRTTATGATSAPSQSASPGTGEEPGPQPSQQQQQQQQLPKQQPFWFVEDEMPCPPDITELGRATWTWLHSVAAYYPDAPSAAQQASMAALIAGVGEFYPCSECRRHLVAELARHPPELGSAAELSAWACRLHNLVNVRLGKPAFDCSRVLERWRDGPTDDPDACGGGFSGH